MEGGDRGGHLKGREAPPPFPPPPKRNYWSSEEPWDSNQGRAWRGHRDYKGGSGGKVEEIESQSREREVITAKYIKMLEEQDHRKVLGGGAVDKDQV